MCVKKHSKFHGFEQYYKKNKEMVTKNAKKCQLSEDCNNADKKVQIAVESTIALIVDERYRLNILCTCKQIEALAVGYLVCEGLISSFDEIKTVELKENDKVHISTNSSSEDFFYWNEIRTSGCVGIKQQYEQINKIIESNLKISPEIFFNAQEKMNQLSTIWKISGGAHMSGLFNSDGKLLFYSEDVGRHNTLDKIIGEAVIEGVNLSNCFVVTSGRLSSAMISKLIRAEVPIIVSISAPTAQGLEIAEKSHMTVVGFTRHPFFNVYTFPERIIFQVNSEGNVT